MPKETHGLSLDGQGKPLWLSLELTYRCPLKCTWCNNPLDFEDYAAKELSTEEWKQVLRDAREIGALQLGFTGGEPLSAPTWKNWSRTPTGWASTPT